MTLHDLETLKKDNNQDNLYDLIELTFADNPSIQRLPFFVEQEFEMRLDNISSEIYKSVDFVDFLMNLNGLDNPLNVKYGDTIFYVDPSQIDFFKTASNDSITTRKTLLNTNKTTKKDDNRRKYVEENFSLPPTFLETPTDSVKIENGKIILG